MIENNLRNCFKDVSETAKNQPAWLEALKTNLAVKFPAAFLRFAVNTFIRTTSRT